MKTKLFALIAVLATSGLVLATTYQECANMLQPLIDNPEYADYETVLDNYKTCRQNVVTTTIPTTSTTTSSTTSTTTSSTTSTTTSSTTSSTTTTEPTTTIVPSYITTRYEVRSEYRKLSGTIDQKMQAMESMCLGAIMPFSNYTMYTRTDTLAGGYYRVRCEVIKDGNPKEFLWSGYSSERTYYYSITFYFNRVWTSGGEAYPSGNSGPIDKYNGQYPHLVIV